MKKQIKQMLLVSGILLAWHAVPCLADTQDIVGYETEYETLYESEIQGVKEEMAGEYKKIFHLDAGRKYFSVDEIKGIIDTMEDSGYNYLELAVGNDALRFLLEDMSVEVNGTVYEHELVVKGLKKGNKEYFNAGEYNELTETEMNEILAYAAEKNISVIPLINSPGHMDSIITCMKEIGIEDPAYAASWHGRSVRTVDVTNQEAVDFTQALVEKYVSYFAKKECEIFNLGADEYANDRLLKEEGMGFGYLQEKEQYGQFVSYVNDLCKIIKSYDMKPMAFNDGIYYGSKEEYGSFDEDLIIAYWTCGWSGYSPASAAFLAEKGHEIVSTNDGWYYVLGRKEGIYDAASAKKNAKEISYDQIPGAKEDMVNPIGSMICVWCDTPNAVYADCVEDVYEMIRSFSECNPDVFEEKE